MTAKKNGKKSTSVISWNLPVTNRFVMEFCEAIGLLIENEGAEYLPSISFNGFVSAKVQPNVLKLIECQKVFIYSSMYDFTKLNAIKKTVENQTSYS